MEPKNGGITAGSKNWWIVPKWVERVNEKERAAVRLSAQRGRPLGDEQWVESTACRLNVTTGIAKWNDQIVIPSGEIRPGVRTNKVQALTVEHLIGKTSMEWNDAVVTSLSRMNRQQRSTGDDARPGRIQQ